MNFAEYIGLAATFLITFSFLPQIIRVLRLKSAVEISLLFTTTQLLGVMLWLVYGIIMELVSVITCNVILTCLIIVLLGVKMKYGRQRLG